MRKANQEIKDEKILDEILSGVTICRVAMMDGELPYIIPFNYGYSDGCLYIHMVILKLAITSMTGKQSSNASMLTR